MRRLVVVLLACLALPASAAAGTWRAVKLPARTGLSSVACLSTRWCEAVGGWGNQLIAGHWNGRRWSISTRLPDPRGASLSAISCRTKRSCVAVGQLFPRESAPIDPLIERWNGRRWRLEPAPKPHPARGDRGANVSLTAASCPGARLCFAVGRAVPAGTGNSPGVPLIERWNGRYWVVMLTPYGQTGLTSISCTSPHACTAVGGFEYESGRAEAGNLQVLYPNVVVRWNGSSWSSGALTPPPGAGGAGLLGVSCTASTACLGVGSQESTLTFDGNPYLGVTQAIAAPGDGRNFTATALPYPAGVFRGGSGAQPPTTGLQAVSCAPTNPDFCGAVGGYAADNGAIGPLAAIWNGSSWTQAALRRGPVQLRSISCPALGWCMAVGSTIAEVWR
jgi:hypothetical protein